MPKAHSPAPSWAWPVVIAASMAAYIASYVWLRPMGVVGIGMAIVVPGFLATWRYGARGAMVAAALYVPVMISLLWLVDHSPAQVFLIDGGAWVAAALVAATLLLGWGRETSTRLEARTRELDGRRQALEDAQRLAGFGSWRLDLETKTLDASPGMLAILGRATPGPIPLEEGMALVPEDHRAAVWKAIDDALSDVAAEPVDVPLQFADGRRRLTRSLGRRVLDPQGRLVALEGLTQDVTDVVRRQEERQAAEADRQRVAILEDEARARARLLNSVAHELNNPLTPMLVQTHMLQRPSQQDPNVRKAAAILDRNLRRLRDLVGDLMDVARLESRALRVQPRPLDVATVLADVAESMEPAAIEAQVDLTVETEGNLRAEADPTRLVQVVHNLVANALKYTPPGGRVAVRARPADANILVSVEDTGSGMDGSQLALLFQPFSQAHGPLSQSRGGTGLGLYVCRGLIEQHGGRIWAESDGPGKGTRLHFLLPRAAVAQMEAPLAHAA